MVSIVITNSVGNKEITFHRVLALLEQEQQRIEQLTAGWDDPTSVDWSNEEKDEQVETQEPAPVQQIYKCTALYSYTVSKTFCNNPFLVLSFYLENRSCR